jgi:hypothetical protein
MNATIKTETLTDGSTVYNVVQNGEEIAHPATLQEAAAICDRLNASAVVIKELREQARVLVLKKFPRFNKPIQ